MTATQQNYTRIIVANITWDVYGLTEESELIENPLPDWQVLNLDEVALKDVTPAGIRDYAKNALAEDFGFPVESATYIFEVVRYGATAQLQVFGEDIAQPEISPRKETPVQNQVKKESLDILANVQETVQAALITVASTDDVNLANAAVEAALASVEQAMVKAAPSRARTAYMKDATHALQQVNEECKREWHRVTDEDTVDGRNQTTYSLGTRLVKMRTILKNFFTDVAGKLDK